MIRGSEQVIIVKRFYIVLVVILSMSFISASSITVCFSGCNYTLIQEAINNASDGDVINVFAGTYNENVIINKSVSLVGVKAGVDARTRDTTSGESIIDSNFIDGSVQIQANNTSINGFKFINSYKAIHVTKDSSNVIVKNNYINGGNDGVNLWRASSADVEQNYIENILVSGITAGDDRGTNDTSDDLVTDAVMKNNKIVNAFLGITGYQSGSIISDNEIINYPGNGAGIGGQFLNSQIIHNTINGYSSGAGIALQGYLNRPDNFNLKILKNEISNNYVGIFVNQSILGKNIIINNNSIYSNVLYGVAYAINNGTLDVKYNWWGDCKGPGTIGPGNGDNITGNVSFIPWLGICIENKSTLGCSFEKKDIVLSADITGLGINSAWLSYTINGVNYNISANHLGNKYSASIPFFSLIGGMNLSWNFFADDTLRTYNNSWKNLYVVNRTNLIVSPSNPDGANAWYLFEPQFSLVNSDAFSNSIFYTWNGNGPFVYSNPFGLENASNSANITGGILMVRYWSNTSCGIEDKQNYTLYADFTSPKIINLKPANNSIVYNTNSPTIEAYLDEIYFANSGIDKSMIVLVLDGIIRNDKTVIDSDILDAVVRYNPSAPLSEGKHNVTVNVSDNAGRFSQLSWFFYINTSTPTFNLSVNSPNSFNYDSKNIQFNITISTKVKKIEYINYNNKVPKFTMLCSDCIGYGYNRKATKSLNEGINNIIIRATDYFGNSMEQNVSLFIDSRAPIVSSTLPRSYSISNGSEFYIKYTEDNLRNLSLFYRDAIKNLEKPLYSECNNSGKNQECRFYVNLSIFDGKQIIYWFNLSDDLRTISSRPTLINVDTTAPSFITVANPRNISYGINYRRSIPFNISLSEKAKLEYYDNSVLINPRWISICSYCNKYVGKKTFSSGEHDIIIRATDKAGNSKEETRKFNVTM